MPVHVNALQPMAGATPVHGLVSYDYYDERLGFCRPSSGIKAERGSLGSILFGDRIYNSPLAVDMLQAKSCVPICKTQATPEQADFINKRIFERYAVNWMVDGLPDRDAAVDIKATLLSPIAAIARWAAPGPRPTVDRLAIGVERDLLTAADAESLDLAWRTGYALELRRWYEGVSDRRATLRDLPPLDRTAYGSACRIVSAAFESISRRAEEYK